MKNQKSNLCFTNNKREEINKLFCKKIKVGDKVILREHYEKLVYFKNYEFIVETLEGETAEQLEGKGGHSPLVNEKFKLKDIEPAYCLTSHNKQGKTINEEYNIYESKKMTFENLQTAIGRATNYELIHLDGIRKNYESEYSNFKEIGGFAFG